MSAVKKMLEYNKSFVEKTLYKNYPASKFPQKKVAVLSCMDTRLTELLPAALNCKNGDVQIIKNAGGVISHPFGSVMRSLLVAVYSLGVKEIMVVGHEDCGMQGLCSSLLIDEMLQRGIDKDKIDTVISCGIDLEKWLKGFEDPYTSVRETVKSIHLHPLMPKDICVYGFVMNPETGELYPTK